MGREQTLLTVTPARNQAEGAGRKTERTSGVAPGPATHCKAMCERAPGLAFWRGWACPQEVTSKLRDEVPRTEVSNTIPRSGFGPAQRNVRSRPDVVQIETL